MEQEELNYFRDLLTQRLNELLDKAVSTVASLIGSVEPLSDPLDRAVLDIERG